MARLYADEGGLLEVTHPQNPEKTIEVNAVNEPGLYHLILCSLYLYLSLSLSLVDKCPTFARAGKRGLVFQPCSTLSFGFGRGLAYHQFNIDRRVFASVVFYAAMKKPIGLYL